MNMRHTQTLLQKNVDLQNEKKELSDKLDYLLSLVNDKMERMVKLLEAIENKEPTTISIQKTEDRKQEVTKVEESRMFIPSMDQKDLKMNVSDLPKKVRQLNVCDALSKLSEVQENTRL